MRINSGLVSSNCSYPNDLALKPDERLFEIDAAALLRKHLQRPKLKNSLFPVAYGTIGDGEQSGGES